MFLLLQAVGSALSSSYGNGRFSLDRFDRHTMGAFRFRSSRLALNDPLSRREFLRRASGFGTSLFIRDNTLKQIDRLLGIEPPKDESSGFSENDIVRITTASFLADRDEHQRVVTAATETAKSAKMLIMGVTAYAPKGVRTASSVNVPMANIFADMYLNGLHKTFKLSALFKHMLDPEFVGAAAEFYCPLLNYSSEPRVTNQHTFEELLQIREQNLQKFQDHPSVKALLQEKERLQELLCTTETSDSELSRELFKCMRSWIEGYRYLQGVMNPAIDELGKLAPQSFAFKALRTLRDNGIGAIEDLIKYQPGGPRHRQSNATENKEPAHKQNHTAQNQHRQTNETSRQKSKDQLSDPFHGLTPGPVILKHMSLYPFTYSLNTDTWDYVAYTDAK